VNVVTTQETCIASGQCSKSAPNVFKQSDDGGFVELLNAPRPMQPTTLVPGKQKNSARQALSTSKTTRTNAAPPYEPSMFTLLNPAAAVFDPPAVALEGGSKLRSNDGGPQHSAGAQFADSIAVPGAAAVFRLRIGPSRSSERGLRLRVRLAPRGSAKSQLNHVVGRAVTEPFAIRTPSIKDDRRCSFVDSLPDGSWSNLASVAASPNP
jgi:ferredoxin